MFTRHFVVRKTYTFIMVYLKWKQNKTKKTGTSEGEIFIVSLMLLEWRKFTISSGLQCFLWACALILCLCFIHFCVPQCQSNFRTYVHVFQIKFMWMLRNLPKVMKLTSQKWKKTWKKKRKKNGHFLHVPSLTAIWFWGH